MRPWRCERCDDTGPRPHAIDGDPDAEHDAEGAFILGYRLAPTSRGAIEDARFDECPEHALQTWGRDLLQLWRLADGEVGPAIDILGEPPSAAFIDAWDLLASEMTVVREVLRERADDNNGDR